MLGSFWPSSHRYSQFELVIVAIFPDDTSALVVVVVVHIVIPETHCNEMRHEKCWWLWSTTNIESLPLNRAMVTAKEERKKPPNQAKLVCAAPQNGKDGQTTSTTANLNLEVYLGVLCVFSYSFHFGSVFHFVFHLVYRWI